MKDPFWAQSAGLEGDADAGVNSWFPHLGWIPAIPGNAAAKSEKSVFLTEDLWNVQNMSVCYYVAIEYADFFIIQS